VNAARRQGGQVLLGVLLLAVLVTSATLGYARHAVVTASNAQATVAAQRAEAAVDSGIAWARQALHDDGARSARLALDADSSVVVEVTDTGSDLRALSISSSVDGTTQHMDGTAQTVPTVGRTLPTLTSAARAAVLASPSLIEVHGSQSYSNTTLTGVLYLRNGASLTLTDCIVAGSIVSEPALSGTGWSASDCTSIHLSGTVTLESDAAASGCSIVAPDAAVSGDGTEAVQIRGVVVCDSLLLRGWGAVCGQIATTDAPSLARNVDLPGSGREPRAWPSALDTGAEAIASVSFPRPTVSAAEQRAIKNFTFPSRVRPAGP